MRTTPLRAGALGLAAIIGLTLAASTAGASTTATAAATDLPAPTNTAPVSGTGTFDPADLGSPTLVGVRTGRHDAYDRTVFDFAGGTPNYRVEYGTLYRGGTGEPIPLEGPADLVVTFNPAYAHDIDTGQPTYDISRVLNPGLPTLRQIKFGEDFEAYVTAGLGLADRVGFRVFQLHNPDRVVVDVAHQPTQPFGSDPVWVGDPVNDTIVAGVRAGRHPGYDRLVFDLATPGVPLVFVAYRMDTATIVVGFSGRNVPAVVRGPQTVHFGLPQLRSVSFTNYGNGTVSAFVSTVHRRGFRVMVLHQPTRLVVDIKY
ncbi:MAG TPA: AMIN domain-containing protein [Pilimelia sp.]|nr:AMIN domain-containing protein [Pilimelia sp.]